MCLAVPAMITQINGDMATVEITGVSREINVCLIENPQVGEYVLLHAGFAINRVNEEIAKEIQGLEGIG